MKRDPPDDFDARDLLQLADLLHREVSITYNAPFGGEARRNDPRLGVDLGRNTHSLDQLREENTAGADPRIGHRTRAEQRRAQRGLGCNVGMVSAGLHRDADVGAREIDAAIRGYCSFVCEFIESFAGQNDDVSCLAAAEAIQQPKCRREIGIDARPLLCLISSREAANRPHQGQCRQQANDVFHLRASRKSTPSDLIRAR